MGDDAIRTAVVVAAVLFWLAFLGMTLYVTAKDGLTVLTAASILIILMTAVPLLSALREPPRR